MPREGALTCNICTQMAWPVPAPHLHPGCNLSCSSAATGSGSGLVDQLEELARRFRDGLLAVLCTVRTVHRTSQSQSSLRRNGDCCSDRLCPIFKSRFNQDGKLRGESENRSPAMLRHILLPPRPLSYLSFTRSHVITDCQSTDFSTVMLPVIFKLGQTKCPSCSRFRPSSTTNAFVAFSLGKLAGGAELFLFTASS